jgi:hypothetical protein
MKKRIELRQNYDNISRVNDCLNRFVEVILEESVCEDVKEKLTPSMIKKVCSLVHNSILTFSKTEIDLALVNLQGRYVLTIGEFDDDKNIVDGSEEELSLKYISYATEMAFVLMERHKDYKHGYVSIYDTKEMSYILSHIW